MKRFMLVLSLTLYGGAGSLLSAISPEENAARLKSLDLNKNNLLDPDEVDLGLWYRGHPGKVDLQHPPRAEDIRTWAKKDAVFQLLRREFDHDHEKQIPPYKFEQIQADVEFRLPKAAKAKPKKPGEEAPKTPELPPVVPKSRFLLRRSLSKLTATLADTDESADNMAKSATKLAEEGALFSYGRHFPSSTDQWTAEGILAYEQPFVGGLFGPTSLGRWLLSAGFTRVDFGGDITRDVGSFKPMSLSKRFKGAEANLLTLGVTYEALVNWPQSIPLGFTGSSLRANSLWKTDWDFQSSIPSQELEWSFYNGRIGLGSFNMASDYFWWRFDAAVHADVGHIASDGEWTKSVQGDTFVHIGPKAGLSIMPFPKAPILKDNPIVLTATFAQYEGLTSHSREIRAATGDLAWYLRKPRSGPIGPIDPGVAITVSFRYYDDVENEQSDDSVIIGLAVGF